MDRQHVLLLSNNKRPWLKTNWWSLLDTVDESIPETGTTSSEKTITEDTDAGEKNPALRPNQGNSLCPAPVQLQSPSWVNPDQALS